jgi:hypothetical protein
MMMVPSLARALQVLLQRGESLLRPGQVPGAEGGLEGLKILGVLAVLTGGAAGLGCLRRILLIFLHGRKGLLRTGKIT